MNNKHTYGIYVQVLDTHSTNIINVYMNLIVLLEASKCVCNDVEFSSVATLMFFSLVCKISVCKCGSITVDLAFGFLTDPKTSLVDICDWAYENRAYLHTKLA